MIKIAIQKSGRLNQYSLNLLKDCGILIENEKDQLKVVSRNFPVEVFFLRNSDIPQYLKDDVIDLAIIGENLLFEKGNDIEVIEKLGFSKCRVSLAIPKNSSISNLKHLNEKKIATSYPNTLKSFLKKNNIKCETHIINGSVEIAPNIGLADAICDIVSSGSTLFKNNLKELITILNSEAVLAISPKVEPNKLEIINKIRFRIKSVLSAKNSKYILMNAPNNKIEKIGSILPVLKSPTIMPLAKSGWSSVHSVIEDDSFWDVIDKLKDAGAEGIIVCPIEKMVL
jgi:ATP phosphoribosyltransferase